MANLTYRKITDDGSQMIIDTPYGTVAVSLTEFDTPAKVRAEVLRVIAELKGQRNPPAPLAALVGTSVVIP